MSNDPTTIVQKLRTFYHLSKKDYNQFGVELRREYFKKNYFTTKRVFYKKDDTELYY